MLLFPSAAEQVPKFFHHKKQEAKNKHLDVSKNNGIPKSSILIGFSIINHPFLDTPMFGNTHFVLLKGILEDKLVSSVAYMSCHP